MATKFLDNDGNVSPDSISSEEDLKLNGRCQNCGKHISKLKPFGKAGDPLVGDFEGALLIKKFRPDGPYDEKAEKTLDKAEKRLEVAGYKDQNPLEWLIKKFGQEKGEKFYWSGQASCQVGSSWECRGCAVLNTDEYFVKFGEQYTEEC